MAAQYPFSRILLATELTEFDTGAERIAFAMAQRCGVPLRVVIPIPSNAEFEASQPELALQAEEAAARRIADLRGRAAVGNVQLDIRVRRGAEEHLEIVAEAQEAQTDLIIVRRRGKPGFLANLLVGEMVSKVIRDVKCSVLLVPRAAHFWHQGILAAVGNPTAAPAIARIAGTLAGICALPLTVLSVAENASEMGKMQELNALALALASAVSDKASGRVVAGKPVEQLVAIANAVAADLVVIGRQRYCLFTFCKIGLMWGIAGLKDVPTLVVSA